MIRRGDSTRPAIRTALDGRSHAFLAGLEPRHLDRLAASAADRIYASGDFLCREGYPADSFFLVREGRIALELHQAAHRGLRLGIVRGGEVLGWSWMVQPYRWRLDARCLEPVRAIEIDARALRRDCQADHELGYQVLTRLLRVVGHRLHAARLRLRAGASRARARGDDAFA